MIGSRKWGIVLVVGCSATSSCAGARRATLPELQRRAAFDLGCDPRTLMLHPIDERTKLVTGCGRRLVYQEDCADVGRLERSCSWRIDSPSWSQQRWPQQHHPDAPPRAQARVAPGPEPSAAPGASAPLDSIYRWDLFGGRTTVDQPKTPRPKASVAPPADPMKDRH